MVRLTTKSRINGLHIDTIEKALVYSALGLRMSIAESQLKDELKDKIKITIRNESSSNLNLRLEVSIPFNPTLFAGSGGKLMTSILELGYGSLLPLPIFNFFGTESYPLEPVRPDFSRSLIDTYEKFFLHYALILSASLRENRNRIINIEPRGEFFDEPEIRTRVTLPLNVQKWTLGENLINSIERVTDAYITHIIGDDTYTIGASTNNMSSILTNDFLLTNNTELLN